MDAQQKDAFKRRIADNIERQGRHITCVQGAESPRYGYTIGLTGKGKPELVLAGAATLAVESVVEVLNRMTEGLGTPLPWQPWERQGAG